MNTQQLTTLLNILDVFGTETDEYSAFADYAIELAQSNKNLIECICVAFDELSGFPLSTKHKKFLNENI